MQQEQRRLAAAPHDPVPHSAAGNVDEAFRFNARSGRRGSAPEHARYREATAQQTNGHPAQVNAKSRERGLWQHRVLQVVAGAGLECVCESKQLRFTT